MRSLTFRSKSQFLALLAVCIALFRDYRPYTAPGERPTVMVLAVDKDQAQVIFGYARALIQETPMLAAMIERETSDEIDLTNGVAIAVHTSSYKSVRRKNARSGAAAMRSRSGDPMIAATRRVGAARVAARAIHDSECAADLCVQHLHAGRCTLRCLLRPGITARMHPPSWFGKPTRSP